MEAVSPDECLIPGHPLRLEVEFDKSGETKVAAYPSMVIGLEPDVLHVDIPKYQGYVFELPEHTPVHVVLHTDDAMYHFDSEVIGYERDLPIAMCLQVPTAIARTQRRSTVRVATGMIIKIGEYPALPVRARDISASGVSFVVSEQLQGRLSLALDLGEHGKRDWFEVAGQVRRTIPMHQEWMIACSFLELMPRDEDRLVAYLFRRQREMRHL